MREEGETEKNEINTEREREERQRLSVFLLVPAVCDHFALEHEREREPASLLGLFTITQPLMNLP